MTTPAAITTEGHVRIAAKPIIGRIQAPLRDYVTLFGVTPKVCASVFDYCSPFQDGVHLVHLLWALLFLKSYHTEAVLVGLAGGGCRRTFRTKVWQVLERLSSNTHTMIRWEDRFKKDRGKTCKVTVDGTDFRIPRQRPHWRDKQYYSHKFKHAALRYEVAVCIQTGLIVWINGPFRAGKWPDVNIYRNHLKLKLLPGEMVEADRGYRDETVRHCDVVVSRSDARAKSRAMRRHETVNSDLKAFGCLFQQWRHDLDKHVLAFASCALLVQFKYRMEGGPKFYCKY